MDAVTRELIEKSKRQGEQMRALIAENAAAHAKFMRDHAAFVGEVAEHGRQVATLLHEVKALQHRAGMDGEVDVKRVNGFGTKVWKDKAREQIESVAADAGLTDLCRRLRLSRFAAIRRLAGDTSRSENDRAADLQCLLDQVEALLEELNDPKDYTGPRGPIENQAMGYK